MSNKPMYCPCGNENTKWSSIEADETYCPKCGQQSVCGQWAKKCQQPVTVEDVAKAMFQSVQPRLEFNVSWSVTWDNIVDYGRDTYRVMAKAALTQAGVIYVD